MIRRKLMSMVLALAILLSLLPAIAVPVNAATGYDRGYTGGMAGSGEYKAFGLDVSSWQGINLDFNMIKNAGYSYVILRAGTTKGKDECFETYYTNAKAAGLDVGAYYYSYATSVPAVQSDMNYFISYIAGKTFEYPIYFDYEDASQQALSASESQQICLTAMDMLAAEGYLVGMYTGKYFSTQLPMDTICAKYEVWIAHYLASGDGSYNGTNDYWKYGPTYASLYGMYQFTDSVWIDGCGPFDGDVSFKDYPTIVKTYGFNGYNSGKNPVGYVDGVTVEGPGKIRVRGWTLDEDELGTSLETHVYIGGGPGDPNAEGHVITANQPRDDIAAAYPWAGNAHGFDVVLNTGKSGNQVINIFGINVGGGDNTLLTGSGCTVDIPADTENPSITDVRISNVTATGYTVTCTVSDNVAIQKVVMPTWTAAWEQDDIVWGEATVSGNQATYNVSFSSHNFEYGTYNTHIYAYDLAGNYVTCPIVVDIPPVLAEKPVSGTVGENTYFISSVMNKNFVVDISAASTENNANAQLWFTVGTAKNQMWQISDTDGDGYYTIVSVNSGKALEAASGGTTDGTNVQQYECNGTDAQLWKLEELGDGIFRIVNKNSGLVLDLDGGVLANGQNIHLYTANDSWAQMWYLIPADLVGPQITNVEFSEITTEGFRVTCTVSDVAGIQKVAFPAWTKYNGTDDQKWYEATVTGNTATCYISTSNHNYAPGDYEVHIYAYDALGNSFAIIGGEVTVPNRIGNDPVSGKLESGTYFITTSQNQNFVVDVEGVSTENSANVYLWETQGIYTNQMWQISDADGDGYYTVVAVHSGKYLDVAGGVAENDTNVQQYENTNSAAQLWQIVPNDDGTYSFYSMCGGLALDLHFGWVGNGINIRIYEPNGAAAQKWYLIPAKLSANTSHTHTYLNHAVTAPTCTDAGFTTHTCVNCGDSYVADIVTALGHSFSDGTCTVCGEADPDYVNPVVKPDLTLSYPTLNFKDVVYYNVYYQVSDMTDVVEMGLITFYGAMQEGTIADAAEVIPGYVASGDKFMVHTNGINAKNLGDTLYFKVYAKLSDGSYAYSDLAGYHAVAYAKDILANSTNAKMKSLVVAMLNYAAAAQIQFDYKTDSLVNSFLSDEQKALVADYSADMVDPVTKVDSSKIGTFGYVAGGYSALYPSVSFEGAFSVKFYFTPAKAMDGDLTMYYWSAADYATADVLTAENATGVFTMDEISGTYVATVEGIAARQIDETIYVAGIYESDGVAYPTGVIAYSLGTYCLDRVANGTGNMPAFAKATIVYGNYAKAYFEG